jgi:hypothetical protein
MPYHKLAIPAHVLSQNTTRNKSLSITCPGLYGNFNKSTLCLHLMHGGSSYLLQHSQGIEIYPAIACLPIHNSKNPAVGHMDRFPGRGNPHHLVG